MNLLQSFVRSSPRPNRSQWPLDFVNFDGVTYPIHMPQQTLGFKEEIISPTYVGLAEQAYKGNGIVFSCMEYRRRTFSQARFQWEQLRGGTPGKLFGTEELSLLEHPWPGGTTADLLSRVIQHADFGNAFVARVARDRLAVLRPDWMTIVAASENDPEQGLAAVDAEVIGYAYWPGGKSVADEPVVLMPDQVAHFAPIPDPDVRFRGMSWITPIIREIMGDSAATTHKLKFFENGATANMVVSLDPAITLEKFNAWVEKFDQQHAGTSNAYKTMYLGGGADVEVVGADMKQIDFKVTQGAGESRIASAAGVPPVLVGFSEGLQGSSLNQGNYSSARRSYSDTTLWDLWGNIAGSLESILPPPMNARLWVDGRRIPFLQEDEKDRAEIQALDSSAINTLVTAGYDPASVVDAVTSGDLSRLRHSGLYSVQLQKPGTDDPDPDTGRSLVEAAEERLLEQGIRPTVAALAESLEVSDRTVQRWRNGK